MLSVSDRTHSYQNRWRTPQMRGKPHKPVIVAIARRLVTTANEILETGAPLRQ